MCNVWNMIRSCLTEYTFFNVRERQNDVYFSSFYEKIIRLGETKRIIKKNIYTVRPRVNRWFLSTNINNFTRF